MGGEKVVRTRSTAQATAEGLRVFVAGVPWKIGEDTLRRDFEECGLVEDLFLLKDTNGQSRGRCFITFREQEAVAAALKYDNTEYGGRTIYVKLAEGKPGAAPATEKPAKDTPKTKPVPKASANSSKSFPEAKPDGCVSLCLKGIGEATEADVRKLLKGCCLQSVRIVTDRATGQPRGIAFVDFSETGEVDKAMKFNGELLNGQAVNMHYEAPRVRPRPEGCLCVALKKLPHDTAEEDIWNLFKGLESISGVRIIRDKEQACIGLAFVEFSSGADVEKAIRRDGMAVKGQTVFICYETKHKKAHAKGGQQRSDTKKEKVDKDISKVDDAQCEQVQPKKRGKKTQPVVEEAPSIEKKKKKKRNTTAVASLQNGAMDADGTDGEPNMAGITEAPAKQKKKKRKATEDTNEDDGCEPEAEGCPTEVDDSAGADRPKKKRRGQPLDRKKKRSS